MKEIEKRERERKTKRMIDERTNRSLALAKKIPSLFLSNAHALDCITDETDD